MLILAPPLFHSLPEPPALLNKKRAEEQSGSAGDDDFLLVDSTSGSTTWAGRASAMRRIDDSEGRKHQLAAPDFSVPGQIREAETEEIAPSRRLLSNPYGGQQQQYQRQSPTTDDSIRGGRLLEQQQQQQQQNQEPPQQSSSLFVASSLALDRGREQHLSGTSTGIQGGGNAAAILHALFQQSNLTGTSSANNISGVLGRTARTTTPAVPQHHHLESQLVDGMRGATSSSSSYRQLPLNLRYLEAALGLHHPSLHLPPHYQVADNLAIQLAALRAQRHEFETSLLFRNGGGAATASSQHPRLAEEEITRARLVGSNNNTAVGHAAIAAASDGGGGRATAAPASSASLLLGQQLYPSSLFLATMDRIGLGDHRPDLNRRGGETSALAGAFSALSQFPSGKAPASSSMFLPPGGDDARSRAPLDAAAAAAAGSIGLAARAKNTSPDGKKDHTRSSVGGGGGGGELTDIREGAKLRASSAGASTKIDYDEGDDDAKAGGEEGGRSRVLYLDGDEKYLTDYQCLLRKQLEVFEAGPNDLRGSTQGRNVRIVLGQVGLRCRHCANLPLAARTKGAVYFSQTIEGMYQIAQNMSKVHLCQRCYRIPPNVQNKLVALKNDSRRATGGKEYWTKGLTNMGVYEDGKLLRMRTDPAPSSTTI